MAKRRRANNYFWHVPNWFTNGSGNPVSNPSGAINNVGADMIAILIDTTQQVFVDQPQLDEFVVTRIVGQWRLQGDEDPTADRYIANRIYPVDANESSVSVRDLYDRSDADSDFLFHEFHQWAASYDSDPWGTWQDRSNGNDASGPVFMGKRGFFDVRVNRRISEGQALLWHTQMSEAGGGVPSDDTFKLSLAVRLLVREG